MKRSIQSIPLALAISFLGVACTNPTVDPAATFFAEGRALSADGMPLGNAEVRLVRYFHPAKLLSPNVDDLFDCDSTSKSCGYSGLDLEIELVDQQRTDGEGNFEFEFRGSQITAVGGFTDATGKEEVSNLILLVLDPSDTSKLTGVFSTDHLFQQSDKRWSPGDMRLWDSGAAADASNALTTGNIDFNWNKIERPAGSSVSNRYRVEIRGGGSRLLVRCTEGLDVTAGGCVSDGERLRTSVSAFSIASFYSDNGGNFTAYVQGDGVDLRYRARFDVPAPVQLPPGSRVDVVEIWAVGSGADQQLSGTEATDGNPSTQQTISNSASDIYVKLLNNGAVPVISDAGLLNADVNDASDACVVVEFNNNVVEGIADIKGATTGWSSAGKFCGGQGASNELSALLSFDTANSQGKLASWLRFRIENTGMGSPSFQAIGEVAVYNKQ